MLWALWEVRRDSPWLWAGSDSVGASRGCLRWGFWDRWRVEMRLVSRLQINPLLVQAVAKRRVVRGCGGVGR